MENDVGRVRASAHCSDDVEREFQTLATLLQYENASNKRAESIEMYARSEEWTKRLTVSFARQGSYRVSIYLECSEQERLYLLDSIFDIVSETKRKLLSPIVVPDYVAWFGIGGAVIGCLLFAILTALYISEEQLGEGALGHFLAEVISSRLWLVYIALLCIGYAIHGFRGRLVPPLLLITGQGKARYQNWQNSWRVGSAVVMSILTTLGIVVSVWL